jgi:hypothetical protein
MNSEQEQQEKFKFFLVYMHNYLKADNFNAHPVQRVRKTNRY